MEQMQGNNIQEPNQQDRIKADIAVVDALRSNSNIIIISPFDENIDDYDAADAQNNTQHWQCTHHHIGFAE